MSSRGVPSQGCAIARLTPRARGCRLACRDNGAQGGGGNNGCQGLLRCMKGTTWEGGFREPGIIRYPPLVTPGRRLSQLASTMDIFVTALELAGVDAPRGRCDGRTMRQDLAQTL